MMNTFLKYAVATALVLGCSIDAHAQLYTRDGGAAIAPVRVNRTIVNNNYYGGGYYGNRGTYNYNCTGCFPGAGPYDSSIAVAGIVAGASVLNNLINSTAQNRQPVYNGYPPNTVVVQQQPQVVYQQPRPQVVYQPTQNVIVEPQSAAPNLQGNCSSYITGQNPQGGNVYVSTCN